jgi:hypothetical protein
MAAGLQKKQTCTMRKTMFHFYLVPNVFLNMFSIAPHFYPICFGKCSPPFNGIGGPKGRNSILQNRTFHFGEPS